MARTGGWKRVRDLVPGIDAALDQNERAKQTEEAARLFSASTRRFIRFRVDEGDELAIVAIGTAHGAMAELVDAGLTRAAAVEIMAEILRDIYGKR
jgi:hypothetical protein